MKKLPPEGPLYPLVRASRTMEQMHMECSEHISQTYMAVIDSYCKRLEDIPVTSHIRQNTIEKSRL